MKTIHELREIGRKIAQEIIYESTEIQRFEDDGGYCPTDYRPPRLRGYVRFNSTREETR